MLPLGADLHEGDLPGLAASRFPEPGVAIGVPPPQQGDGADGLDRREPGPPLGGGLPGGPRDDLPHAVREQDPVTRAPGLEGIPVLRAARRAWMG